MRSFAVDFMWQEENFQPSELRAAPDTPYVHDVADLVYWQHSDLRDGYAETVSEIERLEGESDDEWAMRKV